MRGIDHIFHPARTGSDLQKLEGPLLSSPFDSEVSSSRTGFECVLNTNPSLSPVIPKLRVRTWKWDSSGSR